MRASSRPANGGNKKKNISAAERDTARRTDAVDMDSRRSDRAAGMRGRSEARTARPGTADKESGSAAAGRRGRSDVRTARSRTVNKGTGRGVRIADNSVRRAQGQRSADRYDREVEPGQRSADRYDREVELGQRSADRYDREVEPRRRSAGNDAGRLSRSKSADGYGRRVSRSGKRTTGKRKKRSSSEEVLLSQGREQNIMSMFLASFVVIIILIVVGVNAVSLGRRLVENKKKLAVLQQELRLEQERAEDIEEYRKYTQTDAYIEEVAREKLGLIYEGETVFKEDK